MKKLLIIILFCFCCSNLFAQFFNSKEERMSWWQDARFGLFIHWGPVSITGKEIGWSRDSQTPIEIYDHLYQEFNPIYFDADEWVRMAKAAGMKYIVFTTKHHDGFCMWDTKQTAYNIMNSPFKRDVFKELSIACKKQGMALGAYYSTCDWHHPDFPLTDYAGKTRRPLSNLDRYTNYVKKQVAELLLNYGPLATLWFDVPQEFDAKRGGELIDFIHGIQPDIIINNRTGAEGDYSTPEQKIGDMQMDRPWETCMTIGQQWSYKPNEHLKPLKECLQGLILSASGNGNFLFNVGPSPKGIIETDQISILQSMGHWLQKNGESIYGTKGGPYLRSSKFASTRKGNTIYLHLLDWKDKTISLPVLNAKVLNASMLNGRPVKFKNLKNKIVFDILDQERDSISTIIKLSIDTAANSLPLIDPLIDIVANEPRSEKLPISGIYPSLASFNNEGECGTGAVVEWAGKLWEISYGPHLPYGSTDKLYEVSKSYQQTIRPESVGGTPANRMIHRESNQLFIGQYVIDANANIRVIPISRMPGRLTGIARSVTDPANKVMIATMEEGFYEVDVHTLDVKTIFKDGNLMQKEGAKSYESDLLQGVHGKGFYSSQGVYVFSNNGEQGEEARTNPRIPSGALYEYNGKQWTLIRRNQFTEVTGPGGIIGNARKDDPIWATGWDYKSVIVALRDQNKWTFYRLPKSSNSYDGAHGWNTEWPRIRNIGDEKNPDYLMTMHGMFWHFPKTFSLNNTSGIIPRSSYLKVIGDFTNWNNQLVFGCDDAAKSEFLNKRKAKGGILGPGQSQSNLWFTSRDMPDLLGHFNSDGAVWLKEEVRENEISEPYLFKGWKGKTAWLKNNGNLSTDLVFEVDENGSGKWEGIEKIHLEPHSGKCIDLSKKSGTWIRVKSTMQTNISTSFIYHSLEQRGNIPNQIFKGLANISSSNYSGGLLFSLGNGQKKLGILSNNTHQNISSEIGYYEMNDSMKIVPIVNDSLANLIRTKLSIPVNVVEITQGAYVITDDNANKWCLPLGNKLYTSKMNQNQLRICREVATERDLFNCGGSFYELPAENAGGYAKMKPICSHSFNINDYNSYRGMLILTGIDTRQIGGSRHIFISDDKKCAVWAGVIDDLWQLGKPVGEGGPWVDANVKAAENSKPYLFTGYDQRELNISLQSKETISLTIEIDPLGENDWITYKVITVNPNEKITHHFPDHVQGRWIRFSSNKNAVITTWLKYY